MAIADRAPRDDTGALRVVRWLAAAGAVLAMVVVVSSATMRHLQSGLACADRAACYRPPTAGEPPSAPTSDSAAPSVPRGSSVPIGTPEGADRRITSVPIDRQSSADATSLPRLAHRLAATGVTATVVGVLLVSWAARTMPPGVVPTAGALAVLVVILAVIGVRATHLDLPLVTLANLVGGMLVVALFGRLLPKASPIDRAAGGRPAQFAGGYKASEPGAIAGWRAPSIGKLLVAMLLLQVVFGGWVSALFAGLACDGRLTCPAAFHHAWSPASWSLIATIPAPGERSVEQAAAMAGLNVMHRLLGVVVIVLALATAYALVNRRNTGYGPSTVGRRRLAGAIALLALAQPVLGGAIATQALPLVAVIAHNAVAALLLFATVAASSER